ncbi:signal peptidase I [Myxococcus sp. AM011]|uniref:signal peptidase I n=1 Tax=Myxococcus sp. AM011 TaxID=2745200 RepID=UPI0015953E6E|nr:signal peptidase I [Myxococcus sp. AM011]NVJ19644.1 signal peptidase I [Myxococcus sp. AM011]
MRGALWAGSLVVLSASLPVVGFVGVVAVLALSLAAVVDVVRVAPPASGVPSLWRALLMAAGFWLGGSVALKGIRAIVVEPWRIPSGGMEPSLLPGDELMADSSVAPPLQRRPPRRGEVLVFVPPHAAEAPYLKRVIAVAGDSVRISAGRVWLNGQPVPRRRTEDACVVNGPARVNPGCAVYEETSGTLNYRSQGGEDGMSLPDEGGNCPAHLALEGTNCKVPAGHLFVLGDNRDNSLDSRHFGAVPEVNVRGVGSYIFFSRKPEGGIRWDRLGQWLR